MKKFLKYGLTLACLVASLPLCGITLTNQAGTAIEVDILNIESERIQIRLQNGTETWLDLNRLSAESQELVAEQSAKAQSIYEAINELFGAPLLQDNNLWDDSTDQVAQRLNWPLESKTNTQSSFRSYPPADYRILQARPYTCALYGANDETEQISIVFANKGDFPFSDIPTEDEIEAMHEAIQHDETTLTTHISTKLGPPEKQSFGTGRGLKQRTLRWDWKGHAFLLASQDGEYVNLRIMRSSAADNKGRSERFSDATLRKLAESNITKRPNGDVIISNIPMVNQGPKGYCVPATFERTLRYMQIPSDMYLLAMAGQTDIGGGTSLSAIIESVDSYITSQSRSMKQIDETIKVRTIQKYIDKGLPIIWTMFSSNTYNEYANQRTIERRSVTNWQAWAKDSKSKARSTEILKDIRSAHACLITGYNKDTGEIAVSDSWGPSYDERWISAEQAEQVSQGTLYLINF